MKKLDRILQYLEKEGISLSNFERIAQLGYSYLGKTRDRGAEITSKSLDKIRDNVPNVYYQIFPEELKEGKKNVTEEHEPEYSQNINYDKLQAENELLKGKLADKEAVIQQMQKVIELQEKLLNKKEEANTTFAEREPYGEGDLKHAKRLPLGQKKEEEKK